MAILEDWVAGSTAMRLLSPLRTSGVLIMIWIGEPSSSSKSEPASEKWDDMVGLVLLLLGGVMVWRPRPRALVRRDGLLGV